MHTTTRTESKTTGTDAKGRTLSMRVLYVTRVDEAGTTYLCAIQRLRDGQQFGPMGRPATFTDAAKRDRHADAKLAAK